MSLVTLNAAVPDFELTATGEKTIRLSELKGKRVILYFYPKDNTPGCTQESLAFREHNQAFTDLNTVILGVSRDSLKSHAGFKSKQDLPFDLLSDAEESLCQLFDVIKMKNMYGKQVRGIERSTFVIDENGILIKEWRKVQVKTHVPEVLTFLQSL